MPANDDFYNNSKNFDPVYYSQSYWSFKELAERDPKSALKLFNEIKSIVEKIEDRTKGE